MTEDKQLYFIEEETNGNLNRELPICDTRRKILNRKSDRCKKVDYRVRFLYESVPAVQLYSVQPK